MQALSGHDHGHERACTAGALSLLASRVMALTTNLPVCSSEMTTEVPCLLVACTTTIIGLSIAICPGSALACGKQEENDVKQRSVLVQWCR